VHRWGSLLTQAAWRRCHWGDDEHFLCAMCVYCPQNVTTMHQISCLSCHAAVVMHRFCCSSERRSVNDTAGPQGWLITHLGPPNFRRPSLQSHVSYERSLCQLLQSAFDPPSVLWHSSQLERISRQLSNQFSVELTMCVLPAISSNISPHYWQPLNSISRDLFIFILLHGSVDV